MIILFNKMISSNIMNSDIIMEIQNLIDEINNYDKEHPETPDNIDDTQIEEMFELIEAVIYHQPINIKIFKTTLFEISTKEKCKYCERDACYINQNQDKICWIHSQEIKN
jgi:hypothetical protein